MVGIHLNFSTNTFRSFNTSSHRYRYYSSVSKPLPQHQPSLRSIQAAMEEHVESRLTTTTIMSLKPQPAVARIRGIGSISKMRGQKLHQEVEDARKAYLNSRALILNDFDNQRSFSQTQTEDMSNPLWSANGDIRNDFAVLARIDNEDEAIAFKQILLDLYGVDGLVSQADTMYGTSAVTVGYTLLTSMQSFTSSCQRDD
jgi:hypothetical protein